MAFSPLIFPPNGTDNGSIGRLPDCISCTVEEALDGKTYDLEMEYKMFGSNYSMIAVDRIVAVPVSPASKEVDYFRIYFIDEDIVSQITTVYARQDTLYRLQHTVVDSFKTTGTPSKIWSVMSAKAFGDGLTAVNFESGISSSYESKSETPCTMYEAMFADTGLVSVSGAKIRYHRSSVYLAATRGSDRGEIVRRGKNITKLQRTVDESDLVTAVLPYWRGSANGEYVTVLGTLCIAENKASAFHHVIAIDVSSDVDRPGDAESGWTPTSEMVTAVGRSYVSHWVSGKIGVSLSAGIVPYDGATNDISLGDTVLIQHTAMGINKKSTVVETVYNVLTGSYDEIRVDSVRDSLADTIYKVSTTKNASIPPWTGGSGETVTADNIKAALGYSPANSKDLTAHAADTTIHVTAANKSTWNGKYTKPSGGIPAADMAADVQAAVIKGTAMVDHIIETGNNGTYTYEKYASGTMRVWGSHAFSGVACTTAFGSGTGWYRTGKIVMADYPVAFAAIPVVQVHYRSASEGSGAIIWSPNVGLTTRPANVMLCRPGSAASISGYLDVTAIGRWK